MSILKIWNNKKSVTKNRIDKQEAQFEFAQWFMATLGEALAKSESLVSDQKAIEAKEELPLTKASIEERTRRACDQITDTMVSLAKALDQRRSEHHAKCDECDETDIGRVGASRWLCCECEGCFGVFPATPGLIALREILFDLDLLDTHWWKSYPSSSGFEAKRLQDIEDSHMFGEQEDAPSSRDLVGQDPD